jgi:transposase
LSIREIARRTGLSRNTIRKYLSSGDKEPTYSKRASKSRLDPSAEKRAHWLKTEAGKTRKRIKAREQERRNKGDEAG